MRIRDLLEAAKSRERVRRSRTLQRLGLFGMRGLHALGVPTWGTKSFEFWTLLSAALCVVRPRSVVELGSGRSTLYLANYAAKEGVPFASIEQSRGFARRIRRTLRGASLDPGVVHHVPVDGGRWYAVGALERAVPFAADALFVDGPVGVQEHLGPADRAGATARAWLERAAAATRLLVVDDVQRPENRALLSALLARAGGLRAHFLAYRPGLSGENEAALAVEPEAFERLGRAGAALGLGIR